MAQTRGAGGKVFGGGQGMERVATEGKHPVLRGSEPRIAPPLNAGFNQASSKKQLTPTHFETHKRHEENHRVDRKHKNWCALTTASICPLVYISFCLLVNVLLYRITANKNDWSTEVLCSGWTVQTLSSRGPASTPLLFRITCGSISA